MLDATLNMFRAVGEETRLRIMVLLLRGELTVTEITQILGQSQPRVSRHLKILADAGMVERYREGSWMFYRAHKNADGQGVNTEAICAALEALQETSDRVIARDRERFTQSRQARATVAADYFEKNASDWDMVRRLHLPDSDIEEQMKALLGDEQTDFFIDIGTGTGRMLELFAPLYRAGVGFDLSHEMLAVARANLEQAGIDHAQVRHGDLYALPLEAHSADIVCIHQVLHFLADPLAAVQEATRLLKPGGRLIVSDFAPHELEFLRDDHAHRRLGFSDGEVKEWCRSSSLKIADTVTLAPEKQNPKKLTVKIWVCEASNTIRQLTKPRVA